MNPKPVILRGPAKQDAEKAVDYLMTEAGAGAAEDFIQALQEDYRHISDFPTSGLPRYAHELGLPGLRSWRLSGFSYLVFYFERPDRIDVLRLLHSKQDIPSWLSDEE